MELVRAIGFADERRGFAGNIGTDYFPNVTDTTPLYETSDGGETWKPAAGVDARMIKGICAIDILKKPFINAVKLDYKTYIYAAGRVVFAEVITYSLKPYNSYL